MEFLLGMLNRYCCLGVDSYSERETTSMKTNFKEFQSSKNKRKKLARKEKGVFKEVVLLAKS